MIIEINHNLYSPRRSCIPLFPHSHRPNTSTLHSNHQSLFTKLSLHSTHHIISPIGPSSTKNHVPKPERLAGRYEGVSRTFNTGGSFQPRILRILSERGYPLSRCPQRSYRVWRVAWQLTRRQREHSCTGPPEPVGARARQVEVVCA